MPNPITTLHTFGQSVWYDNIQRRMLENGRLAEMVQRGDLRGMTSNPSIFNQAISKSIDYEDALKSMAWSGYSASQILDRLIMEDIRAAADLFLPLYKASNGGDGYVSVEVGPAMAHDTQATLAEAHRLWDLANHPNVMVKIPATEEGIPAIRQAIADGLNINITLIFSLKRYREVMDAYLSGLEQRLEAGLAVDSIASVASFFVSRIDTKVDKQLEGIVHEEEPKAEKAAALVGRIAVDNARLAYAEFRSVFEGQRFARLQAQGARLQRPLWASTSTKDPNYPDTKYVEELIGPDTVNTVPPATLDAFRDHGKVRLTLEKDLDQARQDFEDLAALGISIDQVTSELEDEGVAAFADAFSELLKTVGERRKSAVEELGPLADNVAVQVNKLAKEKIPSRLRANDPTIWTDEPAGRHEIRKRLGWLTLPEKSRDMLPELLYFTEEVRAAGYTHALLLGMGGSSLASEVLRTVFGVAPGFLNLAILDSTDPAQVISADRRSKIDNTLYIISSKSGVTAEVKALLDYFWKRATDVAGNHAAEHFIVITDPGSSLEELAREREFRRVFLADPKVGGRYSALSAFGLVPAALIGVNVASVLGRAARMARQCTPDIPAGRNPGLVLGAVIGEAAKQGRDKLTFLNGPALSPFCDWLSQLIAESSGKQGMGIIPVEGETLASPDLYGEDRLFVYLRRHSDIRTRSLDQAAERLKRAGHPVITMAVEENDDLGSEFYRWELSTAIACAILGVNPFDQPDVQESKDRALAIIDTYYKTRKLDEGRMLWQGEGVTIYGSQLPENSDKLAGILKGFLNQGQPGDYVAINAYLPRNQNMDGMLHKLRISILDRTHLTTTIGYGPRYLHSIGQLHKGGKNNVLFIEITHEPEKDLEIPGEGLTFGRLECAQAVADLDTLLKRGRRALRIHLSDISKLQTVLEAIS